MKVFFLLFSVFITSVAVSSENRVGNGGDVVVCPHKITLLDFYEASMPLQSYSNEIKFSDIAQEVFKQLDRLSPSQARQYKRRFGQFVDEADFKADVKLVNIRDSKHLFKPRESECKIRQIAIRRNETSSVSRRFLIDEQLWKRLSERDKAGLIIHEIIYEHFYKLGEENSIKARALTAYLFSEEALKAKPENYWKIIREMKMPLYQ